MTGTPSTAMVAQSHHEKESTSTTTSNTLPAGGVKTTATFSPVTESSSDEEVSSHSSKNGVKQTLLKVTPRQLLFPNKASSSQPAAPTTATAAVVATKKSPAEEQMEAALHLSLHNTPSLDEMDDHHSYKHLSAAGEHFARKKSEGEHISLFSRLASRVGSIGHHAHDGYEEVRDELLLVGEGQQQVLEGGQLSDDQVETTAVKKGVVNDDTKQLEEDEAVSNNRPSNEEEEEADQPYRHLSAAGEHFAMKKAEKKAAKKRAEKTKSSSSTTAAGPVDHSTADDINNEEEHDRYRHLSAAGEHFARKKSENGGSPMLKSVLSRMTPSFRHLHSSEDGDSNDDEDEAPVRNLSAAGEHFAKKKADKKAAKKVENEDQSVEVGEEDRYKSLSSAGEHFARKKAEKKSEKAVKKVEKKESAADQSVEIDEADRYKNLSSAGEHFARKKAEKKSEKKAEKKARRASKEEVAADQSVEIDEADRYKNLSSAGEHFARKKAEKKLEKAVKKVEKEEVAADQSVEIEDEDPFKHLSSAGEHFARKKAEKKARRASKEEVFVAELSNEDGEEEIDDETDRYKHLSAAGEHFARKKSDRESTSLFSRLRSSFTSQSDSTTEERDEEEEDRFKHLSSAGEHFARKKAEKKAKKKGRRVSKVSKRENPTKREEGEEEEATEDPSSIVSVHSSQETDTSNEDKECDDHDADSLDLVVVVQHLGDGDNETTLTAEKDGETLEEDAENETRNLVTNTTASTISAAQSKLDEIQRTPAYTLHRDLVIGKGSYGHVYIASRGETEGHFSSKPGKRKKFACKCVSLPADPKYICKLQEEVNVLRVLRGHVNVIRLFDVFVLDNELLIITELGTGGDLLHLLATHPKHGVSEEYAAKTVSDMLSAVAILHSLHICHRDLKIENWVLKSGNDLWSPLKLIDFGLSTHFTPGHKLSRVVGSSYYIAPEVLKKSYTEACDLWSLGVIVYMLLSGAPPFFGSSEELIKESILNGEYSFPLELFRDVSKDAMAFVSCLLSYDEEERYTAQQALNHPWLEAKCKPEHILRCKASARVAEE